MMRKGLFAAAVALVLIVVRAPAGLVDGLLAHFSDGGLRLQQAEGSLWHGRGMLASRDASGRSLSPWLPLSWDFDTAALGRAALGWQFNSNGSPLGSVHLSPSGVALNAFKLHAPAGAALASIPHPAAQAGWQGDLTLEAPDWRCPPDGRCDGEARLLWRGVGSALFPDRKFGDYELKIHAAAGHLRFQIATLNGPIQLSGSGEAPFGQTPRFDGTISGEPAFLARLPAIAGGAAQPTGQPGRFALHWPPR